MLRLISALRKRSAIGQLARFASSEEQLEQNFYWKAPLEPKIAKLYEKYDSTLFFSTHIEANKSKLKFSDRREIEGQIADEKRRTIQTRPLPIALSYLTGDKPDVIGRQNEEIYESSNGSRELCAEIDPNEISDETDVEIKEESVKQRNLIAGKIAYIDESKQTIFDEMKRTRENIRPAPNPYKYDKYPAAWMYDYETFDDSDQNHEEKSQYGTPGRMIDFECGGSMNFIGYLFLDPTMPVSRVQCYGCGGHLQCADPGLPGYLPSELMRGQHDSVLRVSWFSLMYIYFT